MANTDKQRSSGLDAPAPVGQRRTRKRDVIIDTIRGAEGPLSVPEILARAQRDVPGLGVATVYRTVKLLLDESRIQLVTLADAEARYESAGLPHHHHFHCRRCDGVFDLESCPVAVPRGRYERGYLVEAHELTLYGLCPACA